MGNVFTTGDGNFYILPYSHDYLLKMLDRLDNNKLLTPEEYNELINKPISRLSTFSGHYKDLRGKPIIPLRTSQLTNDTNFIRSIDLNEKAKELRTELNEYKETANKTHNDLLDKINSLKTNIKSSVITEVTSTINNKFNTIETNIPLLIDKSILEYRTEVNNKLNEQNTIINDIKKQETDFKDFINNKIIEVEKKWLDSTNEKIDSAIDLKLIGWKQTYESDFSTFTDNVGKSINDAIANAELVAKETAENIINEASVNFASTAALNKTNNDLTALTSRVTITEVVIQNNQNNITDLNNTVIANHNAVNERIDNLDLLTEEDISDMFVSQVELVKVNNDISAVKNICDGLSARLDNDSETISNNLRDFDSRITAIDLKIDSEALRLEDAINAIDTDIRDTIDLLNKDILAQIEELKNHTHENNLPEEYIEYIEVQEDRFTQVELNIDGIENKINSTINQIGVSRPIEPEPGQCFFDGNLNKPIWWNGSVWVDSTGTEV